MSDEELPNRRSAARFLTELDLVVRDLSGRELDARSQAHDVNHKGFRAQTRAQLKAGDEFRFELVMSEGEQPVKGVARVAWVEPNPWGGWNIGAKITKVSWTDGRRLRALFHVKGFDFAGLAGKAWMAAYWAVIFAGFYNLIYRQPQWRQVFAGLIPVIVALLFLAWALLTLLKRD